MQNGWETHPTFGPTLKAVAAALPRAWCRETADPAFAGRWTRERPSLGQDAATTAMLYLFFKELGVGALILRSKGSGGMPRHWLRLPDGTDVDLSAPDGLSPANGAAIDPERLISPDGDGTRARADLLEERLNRLWLVW